MLEPFKNMAVQMQMVRKLMTDKNFRDLMMHPKMQALMKDPSFMEAMKNQDARRIESHPGVQALKTDPELKELMSRIDLAGFINPSK